jgi:hypothetical protein
MIHTRGSVLCLPVGLQPTDLFRGEGRDLFPRWAPAFAGVTEVGGSRIGPPSTNESYVWF